MGDRSCRLHISVRRLPVRTERRIVKVHLLRRWGPARIAYLLGLSPFTVHRVLVRYRLARLSHLNRATGRAVRRYERTAPGELVHVDIKKLGNIGTIRRWVGLIGKRGGRIRGGTSTSSCRTFRPRCRQRWEGRCSGSCWR
jgi:hypothetical protein